MAKATKTAQVKPVTGHPLFPAVVTLWFGALLGLGSLSVHPAALAGWFRQSRIDRVIGMMPPAYDPTARTVMALVLAAAGCLIGLAIARAAARASQLRRHAGHEQVLILPDELQWPDEAGAAPTEQEPVLQALVEVPIPAAAPAAVPVPDQSRPVLDISGIDLAADQAEEPLDLAAFEEDQGSDRVPVPTPAGANPPLQKVAPAIAERPCKDPLPWATAAPQDRAETERALRAALIDLQQLRGAA